MLDVVCAVIFDNDGRFLACRRPSDKHLGGKWEFPGGKVDSGESPEAAIVREIREELAIEVEVLSSFSPVVWDYDGRLIRLIPFRCGILAGVPQALEHDDLLWCTPGDWGLLDWAPADVPILREIAG